MVCASAGRGQRADVWVRVRAGALAALRRSAAARRQRCGAAARQQRGSAAAARRQRGGAAAVRRRTRVCQDLHRHPHVHPRLVDPRGLEGDLFGHRARPIAHRRRLEAAALRALGEHLVEHGVGEVVRTVLRARRGTAGSAACGIMEPSHTLRVRAWKV